MEIKELQEKLVAVLGYGVEGKAVAAYLLKHGVKPVLFDQKAWTEWPADEQQKIKDLGVNFIFGPDAFRELVGFDVAFRSPGVKISELTTYKLQLASQTKWFFEHCPAKIIGVTGTKGKGTTSALIYEMLKAGGEIAYLTGNIGKIQPFDILDRLSEDEWVVYELSSFQLQDLEKSPHIGVILMTTSEHLDYHKGIEEYHLAKMPIVKFQGPEDFAIINHDFPASMAIGAMGKGKKLFFSRNSKVSAGCFVKDGAIAAANSNFQFPISSLQLRGRHNLENVCAAILAAECAGTPAPAIKKALKNFKGLEHRLEFVAEKNGVKFYNDSFSTTPETAIAAIESFTEPLVLILGGSSKNSDFTGLGGTIARAKNIKALVLIGQEANKIKDSFKEKFNGTILTGAKTMAEIFAQIKPSAKTGDVVLLSPACASFDMFKNYNVRGEEFKTEAAKY